MINIFQGRDEKETHERAASLVVLPPLVLGYEELYVNNDDNQPAKKDMDYPYEKVEKTVTERATPKYEIEQNYQMKQNAFPFMDQKDVTEQTKEPKKETTKKEEKKDKKVEEIKKKIKEDKVKLKEKKVNKKEVKKERKKNGNKKPPKKNNNTKKDNKKKGANKKDKKKRKGKKKGKRKGKDQSSQSRSESNSEGDSESTNESQSQSELSNDYDTQEINNLLELLNNHPSAYGVERIYPTIPTRAGRMPTRSNNNFNLDLGLNNHGFAGNKAMILENRIKQTPFVKNKTYFMGLNLKQTTSSLNKLISLLSRRTDKSSALIEDKKIKMRGGDDKKGVITLKGQGEIGEGKEVLEFTGNFRVPKKVLDCPCFKEILQKEKPSFSGEE